MRVERFFPPLPADLSVSCDWSGLRPLRHARSCSVLLQTVIPQRSDRDNHHAAALLQSLPQDPVSIVEIDGTDAVNLTLPMWRALLQLPRVQSSLCVLRLNGFVLAPSEWRQHPSVRFDCRSAVSAHAGTVQDGADAVRVRALSTR